MEAKRRALEVLHILEQEYPSFSTALRWDEPWQLLVAVVLSAQTTDENVNRATYALFTQYPTPRLLARTPLAELERLVYSTGYYKAKARNIKALCAALVERHGGRVPDRMDALVALPGVGRKTANVVLHVLHGTAEGIVMDTHITRVTQRLGFVDRKDPALGERVMMQLLPRDRWKEWGDLLIQHGRKTCTARRPNCADCPLNAICPSAFTFDQA